MYLFLYFVAGRMTSSSGNQRGVTCLHILSTLTGTLISVMPSLTKTHMKQEGHAYP